MHTEMRCNTNTQTKGVFSPFMLTNTTLNTYLVKHLHHYNQIPRTAPKQGLTYLQSRTLGFL